MNYKTRDQISKQIRGPFNDLIDSISLSHMSDIDWWVSDIASRNTLTCHVYKEIIDHFYFLQFDKDGVFKNNSFQIILSIIKYVMKFILSIYRFIFTRLLTFSSKKLENNIVLLDVFIHPKGNFDQVYSYKDRYYPGIFDHLSAELKEKIYYNPTFSGGFSGVLKNILSIRRSKNNFLLKERFLKIRDYFFAFFYPVRSLKYIPKKLFIQGQDVTFIFKRAFLKGLFNTSSFEALLKFRFSKRLKDNDVKISLIVDWFENQIIDRGANIGFKKFYPTVKIIGYQGYVVSENYLCINPTTVEKEANILPDIVCVTGPGLIESRKQYCPSLSVKHGPAFRFSDVYNQKAKITNTGLLVVSLMLPICMKTSLRIINSVILSKWHDFGKQISFKLKLHPTNKKYKKKIQKLFNGNVAFDIVDDTFNEIMSYTTVVVSSMTSCCLESLAFAVPCVVVGDSNRINFNPIPHEVDKSVWRICYNSDEIINAIKVLSSLPDSQLAVVASAVRDKYFCRVTNESVTSFLDANLLT
jgi:hypothetical protein